MAIINKAGLDGKDDFIGFTFNGHHSSEFRIIRVSNGDRYEEELVPAPKHQTVSIPGREGLTYFNSSFPERNFTIKFAFDDLHETNIAAIKRWLTVNKTADFIFDETPYKAYKVRINSAPQLSYICFCENKNDPIDKRVYKGEGSVGFTAFMPWAHSTHKRLSDFAGCYNTNEWAEASGLSGLEAEAATGIVFDKKIISTSNNNITIPLYNAGDMPTDWKIIFKISNNISGIQSIQIGGKKLYIDFTGTSFEPNDVFMLDSNLKQFVKINKDNNNITILERLNDLIYAGDFTKIPCGKSNFIIQGQWCNIQQIGKYDIDYDFLYY